MTSDKTTYKFRVMYEEDDSIFRDIEIKPSHTLLDLESVIVSSYNLPVTATGKFYKSNDNWQHLKEINAAPVKVEEKKGKAKAKAQSVPVLIAYIDDPHQKFIYEYHGSQEFVFLIELISLNGSEKTNVIYPVCVKQQGPSPFKKEDLVAHYSRSQADDDDEEEQAIDDEDDDLDSMNTEGDAVEEQETEEQPVEEEADENSESEEEFAEESEGALDEESGEEFGEDFGVESEEDFR